jgi:hypothetical protein
LYQAKSLAAVLSIPLLLLWFLAVVAAFSFFPKQALLLQIKAAIDNPKLSS